MHFILAILTLMGMSLVLTVDGWADQATETVDKARLQAAMQRHLDRQLVDGAILHLDLQTGEVEHLYPTQAHPMIMTLGNYFVMCSDLKDESGQSYPIDLYMAQVGNRFVVFRTVIDDRTPLKALMNNGLLRPLR